MRILAGVLAGLAILIPLAAATVRRRRRRQREGGELGGLGIADGALVLAVFVLVVLAFVALRETR